MRLTRLPSTTRSLILLVGAVALIAAGERLLFDLAAMAAGSRPAADITNWFCLNVVIFALFCVWRVLMRARRDAASDEDGDSVEPL